MLGFLCGILIQPFNAIAEDRGVIKLIPSVKVAKQGQEFGVDIYAEDVDDLYGLQIHLKYDPTQLEVMKFLPDYFGWEKGTYYAIEPQWDDVQGTFNVAFTCLGEKVPFTGSGKVGTIIFNIKGTSEIIKIRENTYNFGRRACMGVDPQTRSIEYTVYEATVRNDNTPPAICCAEAVNNCTVQIEFNEPVEKASAEDINNYRITPDLAIKGAQLDSQGKTVTLTTEPQVGNRRYEVNVINIADAVGNKPSEALKQSFDGAMRMWLEVVGHVYSENKGVVQLKVGPVEQLYRLRFFIKYDENHFEYISTEKEKEGFVVQIDKYFGSPAFGGVLSTLNAVSFDRDCTLCEFHFMPHGVTSTPIEFIIDQPATPFVVKGISEEGHIKDIVVDTSGGTVDILKSYRLTGHIHLVGETGFKQVSASILGEKMSDIDVKDDGSFQLDNLVPGLYTFRLSNPGYLTMDYTIEVSDDTAEEFNMIAGDLIGDGKVDILDIAAICQKFSLTKDMDGWDPVMDYNNDGWIDIIDVSIMAINYNKRSNVQQP